MRPEERPSRILHDLVASIKEIDNVVGLYSYQSDTFVLKCVVEREKQVPTDVLEPQQIVDMFAQGILDAFQIGDLFAEVNPVTSELRDGEI